MRPIFSRLQLLPSGVKLAGLIAGGLVLACGRYDWTSNHALALRCWTLSAYFFILIMLGIYTGGMAFGVAERNRFWTGLGSAALLFNLPYRWLGLDRLFYLRNHPFSYGVEKSFVAEWLGHPRPPLPWNGTDTLFLSLTTLAILSAALFRPDTPQRLRLPFQRSHLPYRLFLLLLAFLTIESWLHLSNRSPYTYVSHFEQPEAAHYVYAWKMLPGEGGVVNADFGYWARLEELFLGYSPETTMLLVRRSFPFYLSAHLSYFFGAYHSFLVVNLLFWWAATMALYLLARELTGSGLVAASAAGLTACGPGFIMYAAQPMSPVTNYAMIALLVLFYHRLVRATRLQGFAPIGAIGIFLGFAMLTYDNFTWPLFLIGYALLTRVSAWRALAAVVVGWAVYGGFFILIFPVFKFLPEHGNDQFMGLALTHVENLIRHPDWTIFPLLIGAVRNYCAQVLQVNFFLPAALALLGLGIGRNPRLRAMALLLLLPSFATSMLLYLGEAPSLYLAGMPRFNYPSYPAIVLLAASAIGVLVQFWLDRNRRWLAGLSAGLPLLACAVLSNVDAFGFMPRLYYHFYWNSGGYFG